MAFAFIASTADGDTDQAVTTDAIDTTGATLLVAVVSHYQNEPTLSDSKGNTWTALTDRQFGVAHCQLYYCVNPTVGSGHTFTATSAPSTSYPAVAVAAFSGVNTADPFDQDAYDAASPVTSLQPSSITPDENDCLVISGLMTVNGSTGVSINGGFAATSHTDAGTMTGAIAYLIQTTAAAANPTWSWTGSVAAVAVIASFHAAAGGGGITGPLVGAGHLMRGGALRGRLVGK